MPKIYILALTNDVYKWQLMYQVAELAENGTDFDDLLILMTCLTIIKLVLTCIIY